MPSSLSRRDALRAGALAAITAAAGCATDPFRSVGERWSATGSGAVARNLAVADGRVYAGRRDGRVYAYDRATGDIAWNRTVGDRLMAGPVAADGSVYAAYRDVVAFDADGSERWRSPLPDGLVGIDATPVVAGDGVYVGTTTGVVAALDRATGEQRWMARFPAPERDPYRTVESVAVGDDAVYAVTRDGVVDCYSAADGERRWRRRFDGAAGVLAADALYVAGPEVLALDPATGETRWRTDTTDDWALTIARDGDALYVGGSNGRDATSHLHRLDAASGERGWQVGREGSAISVGGVHDGRVYVGTDDPSALVAAVTADGEVAWQHEADSGVWVVRPTERGALAGIEDGTLLALDA